MGFCLVCKGAKGTSQQLGLAHVDKASILPREVKKAGAWYSRR